MSFDQFIQELHQIFQLHDASNWSIYRANEQETAMYRLERLTLQEELPFLPFVNTNRTINSTNQILALPDEVMDGLRATYKLDKIQHIPQYFSTFSPDICFAWIVLMARINKVATSEIPKQWITYINQWGAGDVRSTGKPRQSWGALLNALGHDRYELADSYEYGEDTMKAVFYDTMYFTVQLLTHQISPSSVSDVPQSSLYERAHSILELEYQEYEALLNSAERIQLELPIDNSNRSMMVDTLLIETPFALGALKNYARTDEKYTHFKNGFGLLGIHTPKLIGSGNDITFSLDYRIPSHLTSLQENLEIAETKAWEGERPNNQPRPNFTFNEPWFITKDLTLVASPKRLNDGTLGRKLSWNQALKVIWDNYNPIKAIKIHPYENQLFNKNRLVPIHEAPLQIKNNKKFLAIQWQKENVQVMITPTFLRNAVANLLVEDRSEIGIYDLPPENSFTHFEVFGGQCIIHDQGIILIDDWTNKQLVIDRYEKQFSALAKRYEDFKKYKHEVRTYANKLKQLIENQQPFKKSYNKIVNDLSILKVNIRETMLETMEEVQNIHERNFRDTVEQYWGLDKQLDELYQMLSEIENTLNTQYERTNGRFLQIITIYGFPVTLMTAIYQSVLEDLFTNGVWKNIDLLYYVGLIIVLSIFIKIFMAITSD